MSNRGRPRKHGERYPNGELKNNAPALPPAHLKRIKDIVVKAANDARLGNQIGMLLFDNKLTAPQAAAAYRVGDIYRAWHRAKQRRTTTKSPNYEAGFGSADLAEERMSDEQLTAFEDRVRRAQEAWEKLDGAEGLFRRIKPEIRSAIYDLCVLDQPIGEIILRDVHPVLDHLALRWKDLFVEQDAILRNKAKRNASLLGSTADPVVVRAEMPKREDPNLKALEAIAKKLLPKLSGDDLVHIRETFLALRDRHRFNASKSTKH